jgi:hypothetical protein
VSGEWLKAQGLGRERLGGYLQSYLEELGFHVESADLEGTTEVRARLARTNPSIATGLAELRFRLRPTSGGASLTWEEPKEVGAGERARAERLGREIEQKLMRIVLTESHGTAKLRAAGAAAWPWVAPPTSSGPAAPADDGGPPPL